MISNWDQLKNLREGRRERERNREKGRKRERDKWRERKKEGGKTSKYFSFSFIYRTFFFLESRDFVINAGNGAKCPGSKSMAIGFSVNSWVNIVYVLCKCWFNIWMLYIYN